MTGTIFDLPAALLWLTLNVYHEARDQDQFAQIAVAHATINRAKHRSLTIKETVLQPKQFSWTSKPRDQWWPKNLAALWTCLESVTIAVTGFDFTHGSTHYHHYRVRPYWRTSFQYVGMFGPHLFYKEKL